MEQTFAFRALALSALLIGGLPARAHADGSLFLASINSAPRPVVGISFGRTRDRGGFEVEYVGFGGSNGGSPAAVSIAADLIVRVPAPVRGFDLYGSAGLGMYAETGKGRGTGELDAANVGLSARKTIAGPIGLRVDYRVFLVNSAAGQGRPASPYPQRLSVGFIVRF